MAAAESGERDEQIVAFYLGGEIYGIAITVVREIIRLPEITPIPRAEPDIEGVINLRGRIVPIVNMRVCLGLPASEPASRARVIIVECAEGEVGLMVDGVTGVVRLPAAEIEPPSELVRLTAENHLRGVGRIGDTLILLLNMAHVLNRDEAYSREAA